MNIVDWILIGALVIFAWAGWRQGFVAGVLSFAGFLIGGIAALVWLPGVVNQFVPTGPLAYVVLAVAVFASAMLGQILLAMLGRRLRKYITWRPIRFIDNFAGATLNVLAFALVGWVIASVLIFIPSGAVSQQVSESKVLTTMDSIVPDFARSAFSNVSDLVGQTGVPRVVIGLGQSLGPDVAEPGDQPAADVVPVVENFVARLTGDAEQCDQIVGGSGFYVSDRALITNAHVVAGVSDLKVRLPNVEKSRKGIVVHFDSEKDIAVVITASINGRPGLFATEIATKGSEAVVAGYPGGGAFTTTPARVRGVIDARGENIYGDIGVQREVYAFRSNIQSGNSGGPLVDGEGRILGLVFGSSLDSDIGYALTNAEIQSAVEVAQNWSESDGPVSTGSCELRE